MAAGAYYPPLAFYFDVKVLGTASAPWRETAIDASFQEVSGLDRELEVQALAEGGENRYTHQLPKRGKHPNLVLKRGLVTETSALADWAASTIAADFSQPIQPRTVQVRLLASTGDPLVTWTLTQAYPVKWSSAPLNAMEGKIAVETLELAYAWAERTVAASAAGA